MKDKLKAEIIVICFLRQTGFVPDNVATLDNGEICVTGNGYGLAWSWPEVRVVDQLAYDEFQARIESALIGFKKKEPEVIAETIPLTPKSKPQMEIFL